MPELLDLNVMGKVALVTGAARWIGRIGVPPEESSAMVFLASPAGSMITGVSLLIDGGWTSV